MIQNEEIIYPMRKYTGPIDIVTAAVVNFPYIFGNVNILFSLLLL